MDELTRLADAAASSAPLAAAALNDLGWLGTPEDAASLAELDDITFWQNLVADGRPLKNSYEHWAESCIIAAAEVQPNEDGAVLFLSEEYSARICANDVAHCTPFSVHRYLWELVHTSELSAAAALTIADQVHAAGRGPECELSDFTDPTPRGLGRVGRP